MLPGTANLWVFLLAALVLAVTPGPGVLFIVARTAANGLRAGLVSVAAIALGNFGSAVGATLGLAAIFKVSSAAFAVVKLAGAGYLIYLAITALRARPTAAAQPGASRGRLGPVFRDGVMVALLNPKTALFFAAFLPQFVSPGPNSAQQCVALAAIFVLIATCTDSLYALATAVAKSSITGLRFDPRFGRYAAAGVYASLGLYAAFSSAEGK